MESDRNWTRIYSEKGKEKLEEVYGGKVVVCDQERISKSCDVSHKCIM
jgi:hypothetical protein